LEAAGVGEAARAEGSACAKSSAMNAQSDGRRTGNPSRMGRSGKRTADRKKGFEKGRQALVRNLVGAVGGSLGRILVCLEEDPVDPGRHGCAGEHRSEVAVTCGMASAAARALHGMRGVENHGEPLLPHPVEGAHVGHEVVIAEGGTALGEAELFASGGLQLAGDRANIPRGQKLPLLHVDGAACRDGGSGGSLDQVGLTAEEGGNLQEIDEVGSDLRFLGGVDVGRDRSSDQIARLGEQPAPLKDADATVGGTGGPVGLVVGGLEDEFHPQIITDPLDGAGRAEKVLLSFDDTRAENEERFLPSKGQGANLHLRGGDFGGAGAVFSDRHGSYRLAVADPHGHEDCAPPGERFLRGRTLLPPEQPPCTIPVMATLSSDFPDLLPAGAQAPEFTLPDVVSGNLRTFADVAGPKGTLVVFLCAHCPYVVHVRGKLTELSLEFFPQGISSVGISSNDPVAYPDDSVEKLREMAVANDLPFPVLFDASQEVARAYTAACTPDFFLFDEDRRLVYRGRLDASSPKNGQPLTGDDLRTALEAVVDGKTVAEPWPSALGCSIKWKA